MNTPYQLLSGLQYTRPTPWAVRSTGSVFIAAGLLAWFSGYPIAAQGLGGPVSSVVTPAEVRKLTQTPTSKNFAIPPTSNGPVSGHLPTKGFAKGLIVSTLISDVAIAQAGQSSSVRTVKPALPEGNFQGCARSEAEGADADDVGEEKIFKFRIVGNVEKNRFPNARFCGALKLLS